MTIASKSDRDRIRQRTVANRKSEVWQPQSDAAQISVENPFYSREHGVSASNPVRIKASVNLSESAIVTMYARKHLTEAQYRAAKTFCALWESLGGAGTKAIDYSRKPVDGGKSPEEISEKQMLVGKRLKECSSLLGVLGYELVCKVAGQGMAISDVAKTHRVALIAHGWRIGRRNE